MNLFLFLCAMLCFLYVPMKESIHIYQQNRYQLQRYQTWLQERLHDDHRKQYKLWLALLGFYVLWIIPPQAHPNVLLLLLLFVYAYLLARRDHQVAYIQTIHWTHRAKRLYLVHALLHCVVLALLYHLCPFYSLVFLLPFAYGLPWGMLILSALCTQPLEQAIKESYVNEAKEILNKRKDLIKIGITGSFGKTSVKNILYALLSEEYYAYMTPHSYNNMMGLTIAIRTQLQNLHQVMIAEMGADHVGEIGRLADFIQPSLAIITAVGPQHLSTFGSQEHILQEKMKLVEQLPADGIAILNYDNEWIRSYQIQHPCNIITYGIAEKDVDVRAMDIQYTNKGSKFTILLHGTTIPVETVLLGEHNVLNILAAVAAADALHVQPKQIISALKRLRYVEHRLELRNMGSYTLLDDAYNSNPTGAKYALDVLAAMKGHRFLLTPGFLDLGEQSKEAHRTYAKQMISCADTILLIGPRQTKDIYDTLVEEHYPSNHLYVCNSTKEAFVLLQTLAKEGDCALIENDLPDAFNH